MREETGLDVELTSLLSVVSNVLDNRFHTIVTVTLARPAAGAPAAGDDVDSLDWHRFGDPLPPVAFRAAAHIIERCGAVPFAGAPVDPRHAHAPRP